VILDTSALLAIAVREPPLPCKGEDFGKTDLALA